MLSQLVCNSLCGLRCLSTIQEVPLLALACTRFELVCLHIPTRILISKYLKQVVHVVCIMLKDLLFIPYLYNVYDIV